MVMETIQIRLTPKTLDIVDYLVESGHYTNRADVIRDALRRLVIHESVGIISNKGKDSVKEVRELRKKLSKEVKNWKDIDKINKLAD